jgi:DNA-binding FadR family transcriptional regulator
MRTALEGMARHTLATEAGRQADLEFHTTLLVATGNPFIISLANGVRAAIRTTTIYKQRKQPLRRDPLPDHLRVFEAIAAKESAKAQDAMRSLIQLARIDIPTSTAPVRRKVR